MKRLLSLLCIPLLLLLSACGEAKPYTKTVLAMDTVMELTVYGDEAVISDLESELRRLEALFSVTDSDSEIYTVNHTGRADLSDETAELLKSALSLCERTDGALDLTIYPVLRAWGFTTDTYAIPSAETIDSLLPSVDYRRVHLETDLPSVWLESDTQLDLGSVAKGYAGEKLANLLRARGVDSAILNLGGNVQTIGAKPDGSPWRTGIQSPGSDENLCILSVQDKAVVTSGGYERYFEQDGQIYWHILDPSTGYPAHSGLQSVTIVGDCGTLCDGLSTALFVMGLDRAAELYRQSDDFEAVLLTDDNILYITEGLLSCFTPTEGTPDDVRIIYRSVTEGETNG